MKATQEEEDRYLEVASAFEPASIGFDRLDPTVHPFGFRVGDVVPEVS